MKGVSAWCALSHHNPFNAPYPQRAMFPDYERIADTIVGVCARVQAGNTIYIRGRQDCAPFCELIALACRKRGAYPLVEVHSDTYRIADLKETSLTTLKTIPPHLEALIEETDFVFSIGMQPRDPLPFRLLPPERVAAERLMRKAITDIILAHPEKRWVGVAYPTEEQAQLYDIPFNQFHDMVWRAIDIDYVQLSHEAERLALLLNSSSCIRITNEKGTDITVNVEGRPILKDDGIIDEEDVRRGDKIINLPAGEVYVAPNEDKSEGTVAFDFAFQGGASCGTLTVKVSKGRVSVLDDSRESLFFEEILSHSTGDRDVIGEIGFGLNPCITHIVGHQLTDEKLVGSIHLALGENRMYGGKNESDLHWDLIVSEPTVWVDGVVLMKKGVYCTQARRDLNGREKCHVQ